MATTYTDCITFTGESSDFTLSVGSDGAKEWDGTVEYSTDHNTWAVWNGSKISSSGQKLYLRGSRNTTFCTEMGVCFVLSERASCSGNIQTLLEYSNPSTSIPSSNCYSYMFSGCTNLTAAPELPATTLEWNCYDSMFYGCTSLTQAPALPATTLADGCYSAMFNGCTSLTTAPALLATTLAGNCYSSMFEGCTSLTQAPALPATTLADGCYSSMFNGCTSLTTAPALPAITLAEYCYSYMFYGCTSLTTAPALLATTLAGNCYSSMFNGCTSLTTAPALPAITLADNCYNNMFNGCTSLTTAPALPAITLRVGCYYYMFYGCTSLKISSTQSTEYPTAWRIPSSGTISSEATAWNGNMLSGTGGTFTSNPSINTTYYGAWISVETYNIIYNLTNCTGVSTNPTNINKGDTATLSFTSNEGYSFPDAVTVTGVESYTWDKSTGTLILTNATGNVNITINCIMANRKSIDLTTLPGWASLSNGSHNITIVAKADGYRDSEPSEAVSVEKAAQEYTDCITFTGESSDFTLKATYKEWGGIVEYSTDHNTWEIWYGSEISSSGQKLYLRGSGNTTFYSGNGIYFVLSARAACSGNIQTLLEYNNPPTSIPSNECYLNMFSDCTNLTAAPKLPATTLTDDCYNGMFSGCTSLTQAPILPATNLASSCYNGMFAACTSLTQAPELPATTLASYCYNNMFYGCTSLATAPELSATTLADYCYHEMFSDCTNLTAAPELPATNLADSCYESMFSGCTSLTKAPALPATTLTDWCYYSMFQDCTNLKISTTQSSEYPTAWRIPSSGTISTEATSWNVNMLTNTGGTFTDDPSINTTYYGAWTK